MNFLIDTLEGETIKAKLSGDLFAYTDDDVLYVDGVPCRLSTARSMEAEAVDKATVAIREFVAIAEQTPMLASRSGLTGWLKKWGRE